MTELIGTVLFILFIWHFTRLNTVYGNERMKRDMGKTLIGIITYYASHDNKIETIKCQEE